MKHHKPRYAGMLPIGEPTPLCDKEPGTWRLIAGGADVPWLLCFLGYEPLALGDEVLAKGTSHSERELNGIPVLERQSMHVLRQVLSNCLLWKDSVTSHDTDVCCKAQWSFSWAASGDDSVAIRNHQWCGKEIHGRRSLWSFVKFFFYWNVIDLQGCFNFYHTAKRIRYTYTFFLYSFALGYIPGY